jgi:hypothetical protein
MKTRTCNIHTFARKFQDEYNFCYDCGDRVSGYREAVDEFDARITDRNFADFVEEFANYRGDLITSDREAAAFMFAMESLELLD